jgi:hypothetical protein
MSALILQLPATTQRTAQRRFNRVDLEGRHRWMMKNCDKWEVTELDGFEPEAYLKSRVRQLMALLDEAWGTVHKRKPTVAELKREIARGRRAIDQRNKVKAWLAAHGADLATITSSDQALSCMTRAKEGMS